MIIDAHIHLPSENWDGRETPFATVAEAVAYLKNTGTDAALFNTLQGVFAESEDELDRGNAEALALHDAYLDFLFPGVCIHPAFPEVSRKWLAAFSERGFKWIGELVPYKVEYKYTDKAFLDLVSEFASDGHVLQLHIDHDIYEVAKQFPDLKIVCSHLDVGLCQRLSELPNVWVDISGMAGGLRIGAVEGAYKAMGADRLLYGTDFTGYEPRAFQARLEVAVPSLEDRNKILSGNVLRLMELVDTCRPQIVNSEENQDQDI